MKKFISNKYVLYGIGLILLVGFWFLISTLVGQSTMIFPSPIETFAYLGKILTSSYIYKCLGITFLRMIVGFVISLILAILLGVIAGNNVYFENIFKPFITVFRAIPTSCLVFFFLVIFSAKNTPILIVVLICFPILYESVVGGIKNIDKVVLDALKVDSNNMIRNNIHVKIPLAIPYIFIGMASSFGTSFKIEIMAEVLTGDTRVGLGSAINAAQKNDPTNMTPIFAYSLIAIIVVMIISLIASFIKNKYKDQIESIKFKKA